MRRAVCGRRPAVPVLVVDDDAYVLRMLEQVLPRRRLRLLGAAGAVAALAVAARERPAVAIVDVGLPDLDGYELAIQLRERLAPQPLRILLLTDQLPDRARLEAARPDRVIAKPFRLAALRETVLALAEQWQAGIDEVAKAVS